MIYVTVGNHDQPFQRLIAEVDRLAKKNGFEAMIQKGYCDYQTTTAKSRDFIPFQQAEKLIQNADAVIGHAGIGTIISARKWNVPLIICPRKKKLGEHFNNHQMEIAEELSRSPRSGVEVAMEVSEIESLLDKLLDKDYKLSMKPSNEIGKELMDRIKDFTNSK